MTSALLLNVPPAITSIGLSRVQLLELKPDFYRLFLTSGPGERDVASKGPCHDRLEFQGLALEVLDFACSPTASGRRLAAAFPLREISSTSSSRSSPRWLNAGRVRRWRPGRAGHPGRCGSSLWRDTACGPNGKYRVRPTRTPTRAGRVFSYSSTPQVVTIRPKPTDPQSARSVS